MKFSVSLDSIYTNPVKMLLSVILPMSFTIFSIANASEDNFSVDQEIKYDDYSDDYLSNFNPGQSLI